MLQDYISFIFYGQAPADSSVTDRSHVEGSMQVALRGVDRGRLLAAAAPATLECSVMAVGNAR